MDVKKDKQPGTGTPEPVNKRAQPTAGENGTQCFRVRKPTTIGTTSLPRQVERDHRHRPEGKLSQPEAEDVRDEDEANQ